MVTSIDSTVSLADTQDLELTLAPWVNARTPGGGWAKKFALKGDVDSYKYGTTTPLTSHRQQMGVICSPESGVIVVDVDTEDFDGSLIADAFYEMDAEPWLVRSDDDTHRHYAFDARSIPRGLWPTQGPVPGGDVKSNGFVAMPGNTHYSGAEYTPCIDMDGGLPINDMTPELAQLLTAERSRHDAVMRTGKRSGVRQAAENGQDNALLSLCGRMVRNGLEKAAGYAQWRDMADSFTLSDAAWPWTAADFERHWGYCAGRRGGSAPSAPAEMTRSELMDKVAGHKLSIAKSVESVGVVTPPVSSVAMDARPPAGLPRWTCSDLLQPIPLTNVARIMSKVIAENNSHPNSKDWLGAPDGAHKVFDFLANRKADEIGIGYYPTMLNDDDLIHMDPDGSRLRWLISKEYLVRPTAEGGYEIMGDRRRAKKYIRAVGRGANMLNYPGMDPTLDPELGSRPGQALDEHVLGFALSLSMAGALDPRRVSAGQIAEQINNPEYRKTAGITGWQHVSIEMVRKANRRLIEEGRMHRSQEPEMFRRGHAWNYVPPSYAAGLKPARARHREELRQAGETLGRMEAEMSDFLTPAMRAWAEARSVSP